MVQNSLPIATKLNKTKTKKKAKSISSFDFTTLYTTIPHNLIIKVVFKTKTRSRIGFSNASVYWTSKGCGRVNFTR